MTTNRLLIAPTEPAALKAVGKSSSLPEKFGVDILWFANGKRWGVQRKEYRDLLSSTDDGRLTREAGMISTKLDHGFLLIEGWPQFTAEGEMIGTGYGRRWDYKGWVGYLMSAETHGMNVWRTANLAETVRWVQIVEAWSRKKTHSALIGREALGGGMWGTPTNREYGIYLLSSIDGIGPELAGRIYDLYGVPLQWTVTDDDLAKVPGLGPKKIAKMRRALEVKGTGFR